jgi:hypothetical protein
MPSDRKICITAADGQTGRLTAELLLSKPYSEKFASLTLLALDPEKCDELKKLGGDRVSVVPIKVGEKSTLLHDLKESGCDTVFLIPPAHKQKFEILEEILECAGKLKTMQNIVLLSAAGCDLAERDKQPHLRQFIDVETLFMKAKGEIAVGSTGHSPCIIRYEFP